MLIDIVVIVVGIAVVLLGANWLTDGAVAVATRLGVSQLVVGLTVVAMGTSMPEFFSSLMSALQGQPGMAIGNVVGSNIFNTLLIVGAAAMVAPIAIQTISLRRDMPFALISSMLLVVLSMDGTISRIDAVVMLILFAVYMFFTLHDAKSNAKDDETDAKPQKLMRPWVACLAIVGGLACLIVGSTLFVGHASKLATLLGISPAVVGLTIVAMGTSLPELATSVTAARKGNSGIAIGNVLGSNVFNILLILGVTGVITPLHTAGITMVDMATMAGSVALLWLFSYTKQRVDRWEGAVLALAFVAYLGWLLYNV